MAGPAQALGRRRACATGSGVWQAMMGGKGGLSGAVAKAGSPIGVQNVPPDCHDHAAPPLPHASNLAYPEAEQPHRPAGAPMNDDDAPRNTSAQPTPAGARKSDPRAGERLAAALRENLRRRKQQAKARRSDAGPAEGQGQD